MCWRSRLAPRVRAGITHLPHPQIPGEPVPSPALAEQSPKSCRVLPPPLPLPVQGLKTRPSGCPGDPTATAGADRIAQAASPGSAWILWKHDSKILSLQGKRECIWKKFYGRNF